jgi:hypothetical protein
LKRSLRRRKDLENRGTSVGEEETEQRSKEAKKKQILQVNEPDRFVSG